MNSEMIAVARGLKCGGFGAYGFAPTAAARHASASSVFSADSRPCRSSRYASASPLMPPPDRNRNSRRSQKHLLHRCDITSPHVEEFVEVQERQRLRRHGRHVTRARGDVHVGVIEGIEHRIWQRAALIYVHATPPRCRALRRVHPFAPILTGEDFLRDVWKDWLAANLEI